MNPRIKFVKSTNLTGQTQILIIIIRIYKKMSESAFVGLTDQPTDLNRYIHLIHVIRTP